MNSKGVSVCVAAFLCLLGCAGTLQESEVNSHLPERAEEENTPEIPSVFGILEIDITNVVGQNLPARVDLIDVEGRPPVVVEVPEGVTECRLPIGDYRAYIYVYDTGIPVLADIRDLSIIDTSESYLPINILEGAAGQLGIHDFDSDGDLAIDRVELDSGTDPQDAGSVPGRPRIVRNSRVLKPGARWYRGDLFTHSRHGSGQETVAQLVKRAEKTGLDFIAITDRNTIASVHDPGYSSESVVLIPAMEWGTDAQGVALIYGMQTEPDPPTSMAAAQAECLRVQAQQGVWAIAHPCFPTLPWRWGLSYVNAVQVWCRGWRDIPPLSLEQLDESLKIRDEDMLVHSIAAAAASADLDITSANAQAAKFWDYELVRGLVACGIAGSGSSSPKVPLGSPVTYIYAEEKSLPALLDGLRLGRTHMSSGLDGPTLSFSASVVDTSTVIGVGGVVPLEVDLMLDIGVLNAEGKKVQLLLNGQPIFTKVVEGPAFVTRIPQHPTALSVYRVRVIGEPSNPRTGFGPLEVYAMTSPIYAQDILQEILWQFPNLDLSKTWVTVPRDTVSEVALPEDQSPTFVRKP